MTEEPAKPEVTCEVYFEKRSDRNVIFCRFKREYDRRYKLKPQLQRVSGGPHIKDYKSSCISDVTSLRMENTRARSGNPLHIH